MIDYAAEPSLIEGVAPVTCRAVVVIPARNEEASLAATLDSLLVQVDERGQSICDDFEVILLLNNCTDASADVARRWCAVHGELRVHVCERSFTGSEAHVGNARRLLMDTAWQRLGGHARAVERGTCGLLTTDADTRPAPDWVFRNLEALEAGADVVGGSIHLDTAELPPEVQRAYLRDREYQRLVAELEDKLDPQDGDPCPRHLEHFGGSLACTPEIYARAGGLPAVTPLEDVAFIDRLRRIDARIRHEPKVKVFTSARMAGRVEIGLSGQLREWQAMGADGAVHRVTSAEYLQHRFAGLRELRTFYRTAKMSDAATFAEHAARLGDARERVSACGEFLAEIDCNGLIDGKFMGTRDAPIAEAIKKLKVMVEAEQPDAV